jgi:hypothetical protein
MCHQLLPQVKPHVIRKLEDFGGERVFERVLEEAASRASNTCNDIYSNRRKGESFKQCKYREWTLTYHTRNSSAGEKGLCDTLQKHDGQLVYGRFKRYECQVKYRIYRPVFDDDGKPSVPYKGLAPRMLYLLSSANLARIFLSVGRRCVTTM